MVETAAEVERTADDIASKIIAIMVRSFSDRHQRQPTDEEVQNLLEELTEERVAELMGESDAVVVDGASPCSAEEEDEPEEEELGSKGSNDGESDDKGPTEKRQRSI